MEILPMGDSALVVRVSETLRDPRAALAQVLAAMETLRRAALPGVVEITPAFTSIGIFYDSTKVAEASAEEIPNEWLTKQIERLLKQKRRIVAARWRPRLVEIPVCYEEVFRARSCPGGGARWNHSQRMSCNAIPPRSIACIVSDSRRALLT